MLTIKRRVSDMASDSQKDVIKDDEGVCGSCLLSFCKEHNIVPSLQDGLMRPFLARLLGEWDDRKRRGLFRYDIHACESKVIPGEYGFIAQLNEGRHLKKRPTEIRVDKVLQDFDHNKFNFTKIDEQEVLFRFNADSASPSIIAINVSPIEYGHVLLIPKVLERFSQRIDTESFLLALRMAAVMRNPFFRIGYNSLGAFATINHLHFQAYYLAITFPIEKAPTRKIATFAITDSVTISELLDYPVRGLVFEGSDSSVEVLSIAVSGSGICLQENNIPYNVLISDSGKRIFLLPQCYAEKQALGRIDQELLDTQVNPAVWEISGHMVLKRKKDYDEVSDQNVRRLLAEVSLSKERFEEVRDMIFEAIDCRYAGSVL